jgi:hypothetical protein
MKTIEDIHLELVLTTWKTTIERADKFFLSLTPEEATGEVAPGRNRLIYLLGHLTAAHDRMLHLLGLGERLEPEFDALFLSKPDKTTELPPFDTVRGAWVEVNRKVYEGIASFSPADWLRKHAAVSDEDFAREPLRNRLAILLSRTNHLAYHMGQAALVRRSGGA